MKVGPETEQFVVHELTAGRKPDEIVGAVCQQTGLNWTEAKEAISEIQTRCDARIRYGGHVWRRIVGLGTLVIGGLMVRLGITFFVGRPFLHYRFGDPNVPHHSLLAILGVGILMVIGGLIGVLRGR